MSKPKAIYFDWDGTLVDTLPWLLQAHNHVREVLGYEPWSEGDFKGHVKYSSREIYGTLYEDNADKALDILSNFMEENHLDNLTILPDVMCLFAALSEQAIPTGIVSNKRHPFLLKEVTHAGLDEYVNISIGAGFSVKDKPAPDPLIEALKSNNLEPSLDIWYVGDSETDMLTADSAGCSAVLIRHGHDNEHLIDQYKPFKIFDDCKQLMEYVQSV